MNPDAHQAQARATAELQLRLVDALRDAQTRAERRAAISEARLEWRLGIGRASFRS